MWPCELRLWAVASHRCWALLKDPSKAEKSLTAYKFFFSIGKMGNCLFQPLHGTFPLQVTLWFIQVDQKLGDARPPMQYYLPSWCLKKNIATALHNVLLAPCNDNTYPSEAVRLKRRFMAHMKWRIELPSSHIFDVARRRRERKAMTLVDHFTQIVVRWSDEASTLACILSRCFHLPRCGCTASCPVTVLVSKST
jgi:hypothetical protein